MAEMPQQNNFSTDGVNAAKASKKKKLHVLISMAELALQIVSLPTVLLPQRSQNLVFCRWCSCRKRPKTCMCSFIWQGCLSKNRFPTDGVNATKVSKNLHVLISMAELSRQNMFSTDGGNRAVSAK